MSRSKMNIEDMKVAKAIQNASEGVGKKIKNMLSGMDKPKQPKIDYLTPLRMAHQ